MPSCAALMDFVKSDFFILSEAKNPSAEVETLRFTQGDTYHNMFFWYTEWTDS